MLKIGVARWGCLEALVLVKRMGTDVREGRRRQFNYIGRLLREVEPDLKDALIQAMKDGDQSKLQTISNTDWIIEDDDEELDDAESEAEVNYVFMLHLSKPHLYGLMIKMLGKSMEVLEVDKRSLMLSASSTVAVAVNGSRKSKYTLKRALERFSSEEYNDSITDPLLIRDGSETEYNNSVSDPLLIRDGSETEYNNSVSNPLLIETDQRRIRDGVQ
ncbi:hypothetical protein Syun_014014 [Stephania yunnanensis]|uniref:Uncharacterized protein n=1 Tax=Stephania yunnanensis TaxID=152371 RepID=A0AAP0JIQ9_9MAGN